MLHVLDFNDLQNHLNQFIQKAKQNYLVKLFNKIILMTKKYQVFRLYSTTTSTLLILNKRVKSSTLFLLSSVPSYPTKCITVTIHYTNRKLTG